VNSASGTEPCAESTAPGSIWIDEAASAQIAYAGLTARRGRARHRADTEDPMNRMIVLAMLCSACATTPPPTAPSAAVADLAAHRAQAIARLHDYREAGAFPSGDSGRPLSVFRDRNGVRCPMAELIHASGRDDLVDAVVAANNTLRLADVHAGPLYDWMLHSGLTLDEIAMVQGAMRDDELENFAFASPRLALRASQIAHARVVGRLEMAEAALRAATPHVLASIAERAATPHVATGPVVPPTAVSS
jgi:hypothetical protein